MKTILVTGGAGFIGSHLCDYLIKQGNRVICVDSFFSGKKENIEHLLKNKNFTLIKHNIVYPLRYKFESLDEIYNLACPASPVQYQFDPILTLKISVDGIQNMLNLARKYNAKLLQTSTSEVYGDPLEHPQKETYFGNVDCLGKRACYDEGKRAAECLCKDYNSQYGVDARIVRLFNVYGPNMMFNDGRVVSNFILQALIGDDITVHGKGEQTRSFLYIDDLIDALIKVMDLSKEKIGIGPINIGNPDERSMKQLAEDIQKFSNSNSKIIFMEYETIPERLGDPQQRCADIEKIKSLTNWQPTINFEDGLKKTISDFKNRLHNKSKIIIFSSVFSPLKGQAEQAVKKITDRIFNYDFDLITARMRKDFPVKERINHITVYRVGFGNKFDKYLLPIISPFKAWQLNKKNNYQAVWGIMVSHGALAAIIFSRFAHKAFLLSLYENKIDISNSLLGKIISPVYRLILKKANHVQVVAELTQQQIAWLEDEDKIHPVDLEKGWDYVTKKTKEELQELEILSSRL